ncbi:hypothetical protein [Chryseobacterium sp. WX]|uniref:hypothetical protein n=1 Tax=Chryseobacterium sp. WX TaxID=3031803 RepID=UPI0024096AF7|nr:hypothetical protein [Chryseobacterium sp. WX]WFB67059.1 hypothetical protein PZ898_20445 [Chryseobacterium sp. WX]
MEGKEKMIERIAESTGQAYEQVYNSVEALKSLGINSIELGGKLEEFKRSVQRAHLPKRRKPTNYTKPRNRKKKSKH